MLFKNSYINNKSLTMDCPDFSEFQDILKKLRTFDDKLVYSINTSIPTESFRSKVDSSSACKKLYAQIQNLHNERDDVIKKCILKTADVVKKYKSAKVDNPNDFEVAKLLRAEQTKLRLLQAELSVEEVIKEKTLRLFTDKCRQFYKPDIL